MKKEKIIVSILILFISLVMGYITDRIVLSIMGGVVIAILVISLWQWIEKENNRGKITIIVGLLGLLFIILGFSKVEQRFDEFIEGNLTIMGNATTTGRFVVGSSGPLGSKKACLKVMSSAGTFTYFYFNGTVQIIDSKSCEDTGSNSTTTTQIGQ